jgi:hypothetical protein
MLQFMMKNYARLIINILISFNARIHPTFLHIFIKYSGNEL